MDKKTERGNFRRAFGAGASEWKNKTGEEVEQEEIERRGKESDWQSDSEGAGNSGLEPSKMKLIIGIIAASVVILFILGYFLIVMGSAPEVAPQVASATGVAKNVVESEGGDIMIGSVEQAEGEGGEYAHIGKSTFEIMDGFFKSKTHEERLTYIVRPEKYGEAMRVFFEDAARASEVLDEILPLGSVEMNGLLCTVMKTRFKNGAHRLCVFVLTQRGLLIDFEAYSRACSIPLPEFVKNGGDCEFARVLIEPISYYNRDVFSEEEYASFLLSSPDLGDEVIYGYARHDDLTAQTIKLVLRRGGKLRMILRLQSIDDSHKSKQFHIERAYGLGWVKAGLDLERVASKKIEAEMIKRRL